MDSWSRKDVMRGLGFSQDSFQLPPPYGPFSPVFTFWTDPNNQVCEDVCHGYSASLARSTT